MSVYVETSAGDLVVDLFTDECPIACKNFVKLCKAKYYNNCLFFKITRNFIAQTGDPKNDGSGGSSVYGLIDGPSKRCFKGEILPELKHLSAGMLGMSSAKDNACASQFYITMAGNLDSLDGKHTLFGEVAEDEDGVVARLNAAIVDDDDRPLQNIRIRRTTVLDDPFPDPEGLEAILPESSPEPVYEFGDRLEEDWKPEEDNRNEEEIEAEVETQKAKNRKILLEMIGDRPDADAKAPEEFLFVCKLNPITNEEDLETIFSRFGEVIACDVIRDKKTGDSLNYAFIGFAEKKSAEEAYLKMNNALIDDRRIKVDFSQSMYHQWKEYRKFNMNQQQRPGRPQSSTAGGGILLQGGRLQLKSSAHGQGVGNLGLVGHGHGHGMSRRHQEDQNEQNAEPRGDEEPQGHSNGGAREYRQRDGDDKYSDRRREHREHDADRHASRGARDRGGGGRSPRDREQYDRHRSGGDRAEHHGKGKHRHHSGRDRRDSRDDGHGNHRSGDARRDKKREHPDRDRSDRREDHRSGRDGRRAADEGPEPRHERR